MTAIAFSNTRLTTFKRCRLKYHWQYVDKQPSMAGRALRRGAAAHLAMAAYYRGKSPKDAIADAWEAYSPASPKSLEYMLELDLILARYFEWAAKNDFWKVQLVEESVEVEYNGIKLMGIWDLLIKKAGRLWLVDHKFQKSHSFSNLEVDPQVSHYLALARLMGLKVDGLIYNIINLDTGKVKEVALRQQIGRSDYFIQAYLDSLPPQVKEIQKAQRKTLKIYPNWTRDCCWDCSFYRKCIDEPFQVKP
jgi:hypothetical protein